MAVNGIMLDVDSLWEGSNYIEVRGVDSNPTNALAGPSANIQVKRDTLPPVLEMVYPQGVGEPPVWEISDSIEIASVQDDNLEQITVELGVKLPLVGTAYSTVYTGTADTVYPAVIPLNSLALGNYEYSLRVKAVDTVGNTWMEEKSFYLAASAEYQNPQIRIVGAAVSYTHLLFPP